MRGRGFHPGLSARTVLRSLVTKETLSLPKISRVLFNPARSLTACVPTHVRSRLGSISCGDCSNSAKPVDFQQQKG